ncbi:hypothetical protein [Thiomicrorhabdus chilensis]|uniref:hypothetical protein n=1 Tax=Thiomicrorhabdus chilensis TaxID=63656 RepID=UPI0004178AFF|nr:hypothetical protein [Thiomicrorhabdus chilensis]
MCIVIIGLLLLLLYYSDSLLQSLQLSETIGQNVIVIAEGWEIVQAIWPFALFAFMSGVLVVLLALRLKSMLHEAKQSKEK